MAAIQHRVFLTNWFTSKNQGRIVALYMNHFVTSDSFSFLCLSLGKIVESMLQSQEELPIAAQSRMYKNKTKRVLLLSKRVFCCDYVKSFDQISLCGLPPDNEFYSSLSRSNVSLESYAHACNVYKTFEWKNSLDYMVLYNRLDT